MGRGTCLVLRIGQREAPGRKIHLLEAKVPLAAAGRRTAKATHSFQFMSYVCTLSESFAWPK